jgi:hypothetical protein
MTIINLTQHEATPDQAEAGVVSLIQCQNQTIKFLEATGESLGYQAECEGIDAQWLAEMLTFDKVPLVVDRIARAKELVRGVILSLGGYDPKRGQKVMIGGAPFFMGILEKVLVCYGFIPVYAFSTRESVEVLQKDGTLRKSSVFKHVDFVRTATRLTDEDIKDVGWPLDGDQ